MGKEYSLGRIFAILALKSQGWQEAKEEGEVVEGNVSTDVRNHGQMSPGDEFWPPHPTAGLRSPSQAALGRSFCLVERFKQPPNIFGASLLATAYLKGEFLYL